MGVLSSYTVSLFASHVKLETLTLQEVSNPLSFVKIDTLCEKRLNPKSGCAYNLPYLGCRVFTNVRNAAALR